MIYATTDMSMTARRPTHRTSLAPASFLIKGLYISEAKELEATRSCESAVETEAAIIAASKNPAMAGGKNFLAITIKTVFCNPLVRSSSATIILPKYAIRQAPIIDKTTHTIATVEAFLTMEGFSIDINLTKI